MLLLSALLYVAYRCRYGRGSHGAKSPLESQENSTATKTLLLIGDPPYPSHRYRNVFTMKTPPIMVLY